MCGRLICAFLLGGLIIMPAGAATELWKLDTHRGGPDGTISLPVLVESGEGVPHGVLISLDTGNGKALVKEDNGQPTYGQPTTLITRNRARFAARGIVVLTPGVPSDRRDGINFSWREGLAHRNDIQTLVDEAHKRFPGVPVVVHGYFAAATSVLNLAEAHASGVDGYVITSGELTWHRDDSLSGIKTRGLVIQPLSHHCDAIPTPEARQVAAGAHWQFVEVGDSKSDAHSTCKPSSRAGLVGQDEAFVEMLLRWISGEPAPATLGTVPAALAYTEQVFMVPSATVGLFGRYNIEVSLYTPPGPGPFPLFVFNHGDVTDGPSLARHVRYRDMYIVNEFIDEGFAVAIPARPGVGRSDGAYQRFGGASGIYLGPATGLLEKGRDQLAEGLAAVEFLRKQPAIDADRVVMSGQSAGGFAVSCLGLDVQPPAWLKAIVNFSGGRTDTKTGAVASSLNEGMVSAFGYLGKTSRVPSLWIFAEHDSRYTAETIRASYAAFTSAGGHAVLKLYPPIKQDGHFIYHEPDKWRADSRAFLANLGLARAQPSQAAVETGAGAEREP